MKKQIAMVARKFKRNCVDYGIGVALRKSLAIIFAPLFLRRVYRLYRINTARVVRKSNHQDGFEMRFLGANDNAVIAEIEELAEWMHGRLREQLEKGSMCLVAYHGDQLAGFNLVSYGRVVIPLIGRVRVFRSGTAWSDHITVKRMYRKMGLASELRIRVCQELQLRGVHRLYGGTLRSNEAALKLMRSVGFSEFTDVIYIRVLGQRSWRFERIAPVPERARAFH